VEGGSLAKTIKRKVASHNADVIVGKRGLHEGLIKEIDRKLEEKCVIKVRLLKSARALVSEDSFIKIVEQLGAKVADIRGFTFVIYKPHCKRQEHEHSRAK